MCEEVNTLNEYIEIRYAIKRILYFQKKIIIYPFGKMGTIAKEILNNEFNQKEALIIDRNEDISRNIHNIKFLEEIDRQHYVILFVCNNEKVYFELKNNLKKYMYDEQIIDVFPKIKIGKYSDIPAFDARLVDSIGAFCSFADGCSVVPNHPTSMVSSHHFLFTDRYFLRNQDDCNLLVPEKGRPVDFSKINKKTTIGNDVWIGKNAIIISGVNIGNGAIIGAGAVVTSDVPDYAIVVGVPARIIRYRATKEQVQKLNQIKWWNWDEQRIRDCYMDFQLKMEEFVDKYYQLFDI